MLLTTLSSLCLSPPVTALEEQLIGQTGHYTVAPLCRLCKRSHPPCANTYRWDEETLSSHLHSSSYLNMEEKSKRPPVLHIQILCNRGSEATDETDTCLFHIPSTFLLMLFCVLSCKENCLSKIKF